MGSLAQAYPSRPIRAIIPFPAGGGSDLIGRLVLQELGQVLGQPIHVENKVGGGGTIGLAELVRSRPDGYTIGMGGSSVQFMGEVFDSLRFDPMTDLIPVAALASAPIAVVAGPALSVRSMPELLEYAKIKTATELAYASPGVASPHHLAGILLAKALKIPMLHVPYKGAAPALTDVLGGHIPIGIVGLPSAMQYAKHPQFKILGVASAKRTELAPEFPTIAEAGLPGYEASYWWDICVPAGTPAPIIDRLHKEIVGILRAPGMLELLLKNGFEPIIMTRAEMSAALKLDTAKWIKVIRASNIHPSR